MVRSSVVRPGAGAARGDEMAAVLEVQGNGDLALVTRKVLEAEGNRWHLLARRHRRHGYSVNQQG